MSMGDPTPVADLLQRFQSGDQEAAGQLFSRYVQRLTRLAEQHLLRKLAGRVDGEDVVQSVFRTFFRRTTAGEFTVDCSAQLWQLLVKITVLKARAKARYHTADKRDAGAEQAGAAEDWLPQVVAHEPGPEQASILVDEIEALLRGLPALHAQVLERRLQGHHVTDIAAALGVSRQTVHRVLNLLQQRLDRAAQRVD
jgi:RNA polymerase sigma factor (sigma-70 family)